MSAETLKVLALVCEEVATFNERYASADKLSRKPAAHGMCGIYIFSLLIEA